MSQSQHQEAFDKEFIGAAEISFSLEVSRTAITYAIERGVLPQPIKITKSNFMLWKRKEVQPALDNWKDTLEKRRS